MDDDCLDPNLICDLVGGQLEAKDLVKVEEHLSWCDDCAELIGQAVRDRDEEESDDDEDDSVGDGVPTVVAIPISSRTKRALAIAEGIRNSRSREDASTTQSPGMARRAATTRTLVAGTLLGRYEVRRFIGRGGMGDVYEGFDQHLERRVALKVMRDAGDTEPARQRLAREARTLARLSHPNVVAAHDVGTEEHRVFLVMELVEGPTLAQWLRAEPRTWRQILDVFLEAGEGLAAAHAVGVVHRDFKPQNVLIGADGKARVSDFGLARSGGPGSDTGSATSAPGAEDEDQTGSLGPMVGTPRYMAPEQILGHPTDARADQFSFAVALYEALFGVHPFAQGETRLPRHAVSATPPPVNRNSIEIPKSAILANRPQSPSTRNNGVPRAIATALERGLASEPTLRFDSLRDLLSALRRARGAGRRRTVAMAGAAALLIAGAGTYLGIRTPAIEILTPTGKPTDWSTAPVFFNVPTRILCVDVMSSRTVRVIWGTPRHAEDVDVVTGMRTPADLVPESYRHGCPQLSPDRSKLVFEGYDDKSRPHIFYASNPTGEGAEPVVSCAPPSHRSEPLWLSSGNEFVFDSDFDHPAVFSVRDNQFWILPDRDHPRESPMGFFKSVNGNHLLITHPSVRGEPSNVHVYRWPGFALEKSFRVATQVGAIWTFGADPNLAFTWGTEEQAGELLKLDMSKGQLTMAAHVEPGELFLYRQLTKSSAVAASRRRTSRIRFQDPEGIEREIPDDEQQAWHDSPSRTTTGDILFVRRASTRASKVTVHRYSASSGRVDQISDGSMDWGVTSLPDGDFLVARSDPASGVTSLMRCWNASNRSVGPCTWTISRPLNYVVASPDGKWAAYVTGDQRGPVLQLVSIAEGTTTELLANVGACQLIWSSPTTLWAVLRVGDEYQWTEIDVTTRRAIGRATAARSGCLDGDPDPNPPIRTTPWTVVRQDYDFRLVEQ